MEVLHKCRIFVTERKDLLTTYTTYLRAVLYFVSLRKNFIFYSENIFPMSLCSIAKLNLESLYVLLYMASYHGRM